jgi:quinol monooxygenase YgiN
MSMVVYEVNIEVDADARDAYLDWLRPHVGQILALPGFTGAQVLEVVDPPAAPGTVRFCVQYRLSGDAALQAYLDRHAPRMRADGIARFGHRMRAHRRVLRSLDDA